MEQGMTDRIPPRVLERLVSTLTPFNYRDQVLGDLRERYLSAFSYIKDAASAVPAAILGQFRRTGSFRIFLIETACVLFSYAAGSVADWPVHKTTFLQLGCTVALAMCGLQLWRVYLSQHYDRRRMGRVLRGDVFHAIYFSTGLAFIWDFIHWNSRASWLATPLGNGIGTFLSALLISKVWNCVDARRNLRRGGAR
jgi:hypothetical protein